MRLGGCILLELAVGASLLGGIGTGGYFGWKHLSESAPAHASAPPGELAPEMPEPGIGLVPLEPPPAPPPVAANAGYFLGIQEDILLAPLRTGAVKKVKFNRGGSSISLRIDFEGGGRAAFKPDQTNLASIPRKEAAAYRVNRLLGLSQVAPAFARRFAKQDLVDHLDPGSRDMLPRILAEIVPDRDGQVPGVLMWWIPDIRDAKIDGFPIDSTDGIVTWKRYLRAGGKRPDGALPMLGQLSNMVAFDFLISNSDRWSGSNAKASPRGDMLYFMDNALSFGPNPEGHPKCWTYLERVQTFSRALYVALHELDREALDRTMSEDTGPYPRLLTPDEIDGVMQRRDKLVAYIDSLIAEHGEAGVLVFP